MVAKSGATYINITLIGTNPSGFISFSEKEIIGIWNFFALRGPRRTESHRISKQGANEDPRQKVTREDGESERDGFPPP